MRRHITALASRDVEEFFDPDSKWTLGMGTQVKDSTPRLYLIARW